MKTLIPLLPPFSFFLDYFNIAGNELADRASKEATAITTNTILPASLSSSLQVIHSFNYLSFFNVDTFSSNHY